MLRSFAHCVWSYRGGSNRAEKKVVSTEDLDAEMDAYRAQGDKGTTDA